MWIVGNGIAWEDVVRRDWVVEVVVVVVLVDDGDVAPATSFNSK